MWPKLFIAVAGAGVVAGVMLKNKYDDLTKGPTPKKIDRKKVLLVEVPANAEVEQVTLAVSKTKKD